MADKSGLGSDVYEGMSVYGRFHSYMGAVIGVLIMLAMFYFGYQMMESPFSKKVSGTIASISAHSMTPAPLNQNGVREGSPTYNATAVVHYSAAAPGAAPRSYSKTLSLSGSKVPYVVGQPVELLINPKDPSAAEQDSTYWWAGPALIGLGALIGVGGIANAYLTSKYKSFAATEGTISAIGAVGQAF